MKPTLADLNDLWWEQEGLSKECPLCVADLVNEVLGDLGIVAVSGSRPIGPGLAEVASGYELLPPRRRLGNHAMDYDYVFRD